MVKGSRLIHEVSLAVRSNSVSSLGIVEVTYSFVYQILLQSTFLGNI